MGDRVRDTDLSEKKRTKRERKREKERKEEKRARELELSFIIHVRCTQYHHK